MKHSFLFKNLHNFALYITSFADNAAKEIAYLGLLWIKCEITTLRIKLFIFCHTDMFLASFHRPACFIHTVTVFTIKKITRTDSIFVFLFK